MNIIESEGEKEMDVRSVVRKQENIACERKYDGRVYTFSEVAWGPEKSTMRFFLGIFLFFFVF